MITEDNRPMCIKECGRPALSYINDMWVCGECMHLFLQKQIKEKKEAFLKG